MYTTEVVMGLMNTEVRIGEELRGIQCIREVSDFLCFKVDYKELFKYSLDIAKICSFASDDMLYDDMIRKFCPDQYYDKIKVNAFKNNTSTLIDKIFSNFTISTDFLSFAMNEFLEFLVEEVIYQLTSQYDNFETIDIDITIPTEDIEIIYQNYDIEKQEKIDKFIKEMIMWITYNRIATITSGSFELLNDDDCEFEESLVISFELCQN